MSATLLESHRKEKARSPLVSPRLRHSRRRLARGCLYRAVWQACSHKLQLVRRLLLCPRRS